MDCHEFKSIHDIVNFRHKPHFLKWKYPSWIDKDELKKIPKAFKLFRKYTLNTGEILEGDGDNHIFCHPQKLNVLIENKNILKANSNETLVVAGEDTTLEKKIEELKILKKYFKTIYYEAKNRYVDFVDTIPMGVTFAYLLRCGGSLTLQTINKTKHTKKELIACAFNSKWNIQNLDRQNLQKLCVRNKFINRHKWEPTEYFENISKFKFFACPRGHGVQTPKICECILTQTIPVVTKHPAHIDLYEHGIPMLMVDSWKDLNEDMLNSFYEEHGEGGIDWISARNKYRVDCFQETFLD
tara:strand:+ start:1600 stop:2493 length:894 start_codon:yes stop_codon:yes gene_type:complete